MSDYEKNEAITAAMSLCMISQHDGRFIKQLTASDVNGQDRLMLSGEFVEQYVLPSIGAGKAQLSQSRQGAEFRVWDANDDTLHYLYLRKYRPKSPYVLNGQWRRKFIRRKGLKIGDTLGISFVHKTFIIKLIARN